MPRDRTKSTREEDNVSSYVASVIDFKSNVSVRDVAYVSEIQGKAQQTLLLVPSYLDFVRVRALLEEEDLPFAAVSEYTEPRDVSRSRSALQQSALPLLLYTERAHFFRRHRLRGARNLAVYAPPSNAHFYVELAQMLEQGGGGTAVVLYCRLDLMPLQRLAGSERAARMLKDDKPSFLFC